VIAEITLDQDAPTIRETHTGMVFLIDDRADELKQPVTFPSSTSACASNDRPRAVARSRSG
jgi:aminoglycoside phosphotransferase family enzyme